VPVKTLGGASFDSVQARWDFLDGSEVTFLGTVEELSYGAIEASTEFVRKQKSVPQAPHL